MSHAISMRLKRAQDKLEINNAIASICLSSLFILTTYGIDTKTSELVKYIELIIIIDLILDWLLFMIMAENRLGYMFSLQSLISYITIASSLFCINSHDIEFIDKYELKFMKTLRVFSISRF